MAYWALKTWEDDDQGYTKDKDKWEYFLKDQVIAIGWRQLDICLTKDSEQEEIKKALKVRWPNSRAASTIYKFIHIEEKDHVLLCRGYNQNTPGPIRLYGTAENIGRFYDDSKPEWGWRFKHVARIKAFKKDHIPKDTLIEFLDGKKIFIGTLNTIDEAQFNRIIEWAEKDC